MSQRSLSRTFEIKITDETHLEDFAQKFDEVMRPAFVYLTEQIAREAKINSPKYRTIFQQGIQPVVESPAPMTMTGQVVGTAPYSNIIEGVDEEGNETEYARRPGTAFPNIGELSLWVERIIGIEKVRAHYLQEHKLTETKVDDDVLLRDATLGVGRKIVRDGIKPARPIGNAFRRNLPLINRTMDEAVDELLK